MARKLTKTQKEAKRILQYLNRKEKEGWIFNFIPEVSDVVKQGKNGEYIIRPNASFRTLKKTTARLLKIGAEIPEAETGIYRPAKEIEQETRRKAGYKGAVTRKRNTFNKWIEEVDREVAKYDDSYYEDLYSGYDWTSYEDTSSYFPSATDEIVDRIRNALESYSPPADWDSGYATYRQKGIDYLLDVLDSNIASYGKEVVARRIESANLMIDDLLEMVEYESNSTTSRNALLQLVHAINGSRIGEDEAKNIDGYLEANE